MSRIGLTAKNFLAGALALVLVAGILYFTRRDQDPQVGHLQARIDDLALKLSTETRQRNEASQAVEDLMLTLGRRNAELQKQLGELSLRISRLESNP